MAKVIEIKQDTIVVRMDVDELHEIHALIKEYDEVYFQLPSEELKVSKWPQLRTLLKKIFPVIEEKNTL